MRVIKYLGSNVAGNFILLLLNVSKNAIHTHMDISQGIGALLLSKMAFLKRVWQKVKVLSCT